MFPSQKYSVSEIIVAEAFDDRPRMALAGTSHIKMARFRHSYAFTDLNASSSPTPSAV